MLFPRKYRCSFSTICHHFHNTKTLCDGKVGKFHHTYNKKIVIRNRLVEPVSFFQIHTSFYIDANEVNYEDLLDYT